METDSYGVITGILFIGFWAFMFFRKRSKAKNDGFKMYQQVCRSNVDYLNGLIPEVYVEKYRDIVEYSGNFDEYSTKYDQMRNEIINEGINPEPLNLLAVKVKNEIDKL